jgi:hypothetical protein
MFDLACLMPHSGTSGLSAFNVWIGAVGYRADGSPMDSLGQSAASPLGENPQLPRLLEVARRLPHATGHLSL